MAKYTSWFFLTHSYRCKDSWPFRCYGPRTSRKWRNAIKKETPHTHRKRIRGYRSPKPITRTKLLDRPMMHTPEWVNRKGGSRKPQPDPFGMVPIYTQIVARAERRENRTVGRMMVGARAKEKVTHGIIKYAKQYLSLLLKEGGGP